MTHEDQSPPHSEQGAPSSPDQLPNSASSPEQVPEGDQQELEYLEVSAETDHSLLLSHTELRDKARNYVPVGRDGVVIYADPAIAESMAELLQELNEHVTSEAFAEQCALANQMLPASYDKLDPARILPIFVHSTATMESITSDRTLGFVDEKKRVINMTEKGLSAHEWKRIILHELVHTSEPTGHYTTLSVFHEGVTTLIQHCDQPEVVHKDLVEDYRAIKNPAGHPLQRAFVDGFHLNMSQLFAVEAYEKREGQNGYNFAALVTLYDLTASFLAWYRETVDKDLAFLSAPSIKFENEIFDLIVKIYPNKEEVNPDYIPPEPPRDIDPLLPPQRQRDNPFPTITKTTFPEELRFFSSVYFVLAYHTSPDLRGMVAALQEDVAQQKDPLETKTALYKLKEESEAVIRQLETNYSEFISQGYL